MNNDQIRNERFLHKTILSWLQTESKETSFQVYFFNSNFFLSLTTALEKVSVSLNNKMTQRNPIEI